MSLRSTLLTAGSMLALLLSAGGALAQTPGPQDEPAGEVESVVVTARRLSEATVAIGTDETTNTISVTREALLSAPSGVSGLKVLEQLPGFNVQANDALGLYEFGNSVFVRAFNSQQIGFVLDNIPMGRSDQFGGSPIFRYVDDENLARVTASQGAGDVSLPSYASLGPIVQYFTIDPQPELGATVAYTLGSDELSRSFFRLGTGEHRGLSGYFSRSKIDSELWRGPGTIDREHIEAKARWEISPRADVTFNYVYNDFFDFDTPSVTVAQYLGTAGDLFGRSGRYFGYLGSVPDLPPLATAPGVRFSNAAYNQYYLQAINQRTDSLYGATARFSVSDTVDVTATAYYEDKQGYGVSPEAYATSLTNYNAERLIIPGLFAPRGLQYGLSTTEGERSGAAVRVDWRLANHTVSFGGWIENDDYTRTQARYNQAGGDPAGQPLLNEPVHLQRDYNSVRDTVQLFVKDTVSLLDDRLKIELGVKALTIDYQIDGYRNPADYIASRQPVITDSWSDSFLPQVGAVFELSRTDQVFASYAENLALPRGADDIFSQASPLAPGPEAETAKNWEFGYRTNRPTFNAAIAIFQTRFENRLQAFASPVPGSTTTETFFQNVGGVESHGAEFSGVWKPAQLEGWAYFNLNLTYNVAEFEDDFATFAIAGNRLPDNAEWLAQAGVTIEPYPWLIANLSARYLSDRYSNFLNTEDVGGYTAWNAYVDIGDGEDFGPLRGVKLRFNIDNIFDEDYLGTISTTINTPASFRPGPDRTMQFTITGSY